VLEGSTYTLFQFFFTFAPKKAPTILAFLVFLHALKLVRSIREYCVDKGIKFRYYKLL